ncbi:MAG: glycosyltransferase 87 family protein [Candidatus Lernaella stagnicola]|nr:glycosyltransferase 87 family protein [Candidatus Lernaella stagnicola]
MSAKEFFTRHWHKKMDAARPPRLHIVLFWIVTTVLAVWLISQRRAWGYQEFKAWAALIFGIYVILRVFLRPRDWLERLPLQIILFLMVFFTLLHAEGKDANRLVNHDRIRTWNVYHYYMGAKYFDELGYLDLYTHTILADREDRNHLENIRKLRDLTDYRKKRVADLVPEERNLEFTDARWRDFQRDLRALLPRASGPGWGNMLVDRGYNGTPFWNTYGAALAETLSIRGRGDRRLLCSLDFFVYALIFLAICFAFGLEPALLFVAGVALMPQNDHRFIGGFLQYDWLAAIVLGVCFLKKRMPIPAAISLGLGTLMRLFPLVLAAGLAVPAFRQLLREKRIDKFYWKFFAAFVLTGMLGLWIGSWNARGWNSWLEWKSEIDVHNHEHVYGGRRVGLKHLFTKPFGYGPDDGHFDKRRMLKKQKPYYWAAAAAFLALFLAATWRRGRFNAVLLAMIVVFALLVSSRYYWSMIAFLLFWQRNDEDDEEWHPTIFAGVAVFFVSWHLWRYIPTVKDFYFHYIRFNSLIAMLFAAWALWLIGKDMRDVGWLARPERALRRMLQSPPPEEETLENAAPTVTPEVESTPDVAKSEDFD